MKLGFLTAIMADKTFEEVVDYASEQGFSCIEVACWPKDVGRILRTFKIKKNVEVTDNGKIII